MLCLLWFVLFFSATALCLFGPDDTIPCCFVSLNEYFLLSFWGGMQRRFGQLFYACVFSSRAWLVLFVAGVIGY